MKDRLVDDKISELRSRMNRVLHERDFCRDIWLRTQIKLENLQEDYFKISTKATQWMVFAFFGWLFFALSWIPPVIRFIFYHHHK